MTCSDETKNITLLSLQGRLYCPEAILSHKDSGTGQQFVNELCDDMKELASYSVKHGHSISSTTMVTIVY